MRNLLCVIGRHEWRINTTPRGGRLRCADDHSVITVEATTLQRTGQAPAPIEVSHPHPFNHPPMGAALIYGITSAGAQLTAEKPPERTVLGGARDISRVHRTRSMITLRGVTTIPLYSPSGTRPTSRFAPEPNDPDGRPAASLPASHSFAGGRMRVRDSIESHLTIVFAALAFSRDAQARNVFVSKGAAGHCPGLPTARGDQD